MVYLAPSILSADFANLGKEISLIESDVDYIHIDVMDGEFVPNITIGPLVIKSIRKYTNKIFDVHLMINNPQRYINEFAEAGADIIGIHSESCIHLHSAVHKIKSLGKKVSVVLNPATPLCVLDYILKDLDLVTIMTVNPGFSNQTYINQMTDKIKKLRNIIDENNLKVLIEIDGGIKLENLNEVIEAGANIIVAGSSIFDGDTKKNIANFNYIIKNKNLQIDCRFVD